MNSVIAPGRAAYIALNGCVVVYSERAGAKDGYLSITKGGVIEDNAYAPPQEISMYFSDEGLKEFGEWIVGIASAKMLAAALSETKR